ncbi:hypothetical protein Slala03_05130 [Streptomyces lavendulae subsp. lavendulae]|nr:hypothetical protein Slala03_05130 [Streptomyces lavendulae subsp. lavendulae]GLX35395.1 hypothetical protein Sros01_14680 [Streptomyces roseochromogenus]
MITWGAGPGGSAVAAVAALAVSGSVTAAAVVAVARAEEATLRQPRRQPQSVPAGRDVAPEAFRVVPRTRLRARAGARPGRGRQM